MPWLHALGLLGLVLVATGLAEERYRVMVFKDGRSIQARSWEVKGDVTHITLRNGMVTAVRTANIDFERTRKATEIALRPPTPTPSPVVKERSLVEVARELRERRRRLGGPEPSPGVPTRTAVPAGGEPAGQRDTATLTPEPPPAPPVATGTTPGPTATPTQIASAQLPTPDGSPRATGATPGGPRPGAAAGPPILLYAGICLAAILSAGGAVLFLRRRRPAARPARAATAGPLAAASTRAAREDQEDLLTPAFQDDSPAADLPPVAESFDPDSRALPEAGRAQLPAAPPEIGGGREAPSSSSVLEAGREIQIRIGTDVYTCPDAETLQHWVEEGRVIENSEILTAEGTWLMAGSIPELEQAFERRRESLGY